MDTPSNSIGTVDGLAFPRFEEYHLDFFRMMIATFREDRLSLEPDKVDREVFNIHWNCILAMENQFQWLIDYDKATKEAQVQSHNTEKLVSASKIYNTMQRPNLDMRDIEHLI